MEELDKIKNKISKYHSPLSTQEEWNALLIKKDNISLQSKLKRRNLFLILSSLGMLLLLGTCSYNSYYEQLGKTSPSLINDLIETKNEGKTILGNQEKNHATSNKQEISDENEGVASNKISAQNVQGSSDLKESFQSEKILDDQKAATELNGSSLDKINDSSKVFKENKAIRDRKNLDERTGAILPAIRTEKTEKAKTANSSEQNIALLPLIQSSLNHDRILQAMPKAMVIDTKNQISKTNKSNYLLLELLGQGAYYSMNYGKNILDSKLGRTEMQIGLSFAPLKLRKTEMPFRIKTFLVPISLNQSIPLNDQHHLSLGLGLTILANRDVDDINIMKLGQFNLSYVLHRKFGYIYTPNNKRIFYKAELVLPYRSSERSSQEVFPCLICNSNEVTDLQNPIPDLWLSFGLGWRF